MATMAQVQMQCGTTKLTAWVPVDDKPFKVGDRLVLKTDTPLLRDKQWEVFAIGEMRRDSSTLHTDWKVGGIDTVDHP